MGFEDVVSILGSGIRLGVPLILACLAGLWSERSGIVDIGLEGKILTGAFAGACFAFYFGSAWAGMLGGVAATILVSLVHGYASIDQRANQIVSGTAIFMVADGMTALIGNAIASSDRVHGFAYTIRRRDGRLIEIAQADRQPLPPGTRVSVSYGPGRRARVAPMYGPGPGGPGPGGQLCALAPTT